MDTISVPTDRHDLDDVVGDDQARCPHCRRPVPLPERCPDGCRPLAEWVPCDVFFQVDDEAA